MTIGVFDSGVGGLTVHRALVDCFGRNDLIYLADQANAPIGERSGEEIVELTRVGCEWLFSRGCDLVILACNTASAIALRRLQQTWLPDYRRQQGQPRNVLGIIVPTIEEATGLPWEHQAEQRDGARVQTQIVGVFSTPATAASRVYETEIDKRRQDVAVFSEPCPSLARLIEEGADRDVLAATVADHVAALLNRLSRLPDQAVLGCTHYEIIADLFRAALPPNLPLIRQPPATARALARYLDRHPEYEHGGSGLRHFFTTGRPGLQSDLAAAFWGGPLRFEAA